MRIAVLGAGRIGAAHIAALAANPRVDELVVADLDADRTAALAGGKVRPADLDAALAARPDGVVITVPTPGHAELIERCVQARIPTFCEKPIAPSLAQTAAVVAKVDSSGVTVQIGFQRRFDPGYLAARAAVQAGRLGQVRRVHLTTCDPAPPPASFIATSGGIFRDCHVHDFDALRWVTGREVVSVTATGSNRGARYFADAGDVDESAGYAVLDDGTLATFQGSRYNGQGYDVRMEIAGTGGQLSVGLDDRVPLVSAEAGADFPAGPPWAGFAERFEAAYRNELAAFVDVVATGAPSPCPPSDVLASMLVAEAADASYRSGRTVAVAEIRT